MDENGSVPEPPDDEFQDMTVDDVDSSPSHVSLDDEDEDGLSEEAADKLGGLSREVQERIRAEKANHPQMFVSGWEEDEQGIEKKDETNPVDVFLGAAEEGDFERVREMLEVSPHLLHATDSDLYTALHRAAYGNHKDIVSYLLAMGADPEARTGSGWTALHSASIWANPEVVALLLSHGVDVNAKSNGNLTALHLAISSKEDGERALQTVRFLLQAPGIDPGVVTGAGDTTLDLARRSYPAIYELVQRFYEKI